MYRTSPLAVTTMDKRLGQIYSKSLFQGSGIFSINYVDSKMRGERTSQNRPAGSSAASLTSSGTQIRIAGVEPSLSSAMALPHQYRES